jgi:uncharacterized protein
MATSTLIERARRSARLTQAELATRAGTSQAAVARYERGIDVPTIPTLERLLRSCGRELRLTSSPSASRLPSSVRGQIGDQAARLRHERPRLLEAARRRGIRNVRVFGSVARGDARPDSDIDLLVALEPGRTLLDLAGFRGDAQTIVDFDVDVVTAETLRQEFSETVLSEAVPL